MDTRRAAAFAILFLGIAAAIELAMGRHPICTCGTVDLWVSARDSYKTSQMIADWYSPSHVIHGLLFYMVLWLVFRRWDIQWRFLVALAVETAWEIFENTPFVIDRYRATAAAAGYAGDSVLNSMCDILMMCLGFLAARKLPLWASVAIMLLLELVPLYLIRDNLTLNVWMFIWPDASVQAWQSRV
jgi:hypothetical protein